MISALTHRVKLVLEPQLIQQEANRRIFFGDRSIHWNDFYQGLPGLSNDEGSPLKAGSASFESSFDRNFQAGTLNYQSFATYPRRRPRRQAVRSCGDSKASKWVSRRSFTPHLEDLLHLGLPTDLKSIRERQSAQHHKPNGHHRAGAGASKPTCPGVPWRDLTFARTTPGDPE